MFIKYEEQKIRFRLSSSVGASFLIDSILDGANIMGPVVTATLVVIVVLSRFFFVCREDVGSDSTNLD